MGNTALIEIPVNVLFNPKISEIKFVAITCTGLGPVLIQLGHPAL